MFANTGKTIKKPLICLRKRKNRLFIYSDDSRHVECIALLSKLNTEHHLDLEIGEDELSEIDFSKEAMSS